MRYETIGGSPMKFISHIAIYTNDIDRLSKFYENYFWAVKDADYKNPDTGLQTRFLHFNGNSRLEILSKPGLTEPKANQATGFTHIAFGVGSEEEVDSITADLIRDGNPLIKPPHKTGDGCYESCVADPDGNEVEITV